MPISEPVWTAENMNREKGETTFKKCGWCKFAGCGSYRYNTMLIGDCDLLKEYDNEVTWNTDCKIIKLGKSDLKDIIESKEHTINEVRQTIKSTQSEIGELKKLIKKVPNIPPLPNSRDAEHFPLKVKVWVFLEKSKNVPKTAWYLGTTVNGYRSGDGCVSYVLDKLPESQEGWGCGCAVPTIMLNWEFDYFQKNPDEFKRWLAAADKKYNGEKIPVGEMLNEIKRLFKTTIISGEEISKRHGHLFFDRIKS